MKKSLIKSMVNAAATAAMIFAGMAGNVYAEEVAGPAEGDTYNLTILYDNDIHGRTDRLAQFKTIIDQVRAKEDNVLVLNGGDIFLRGEHQDEQGNEQIQNLISTAEFPTLCGNVVMKDTGEYIENVDPYIIKELGGLNIGIIGITSLKPQNREWEEVSDKTFESGEITTERLIGEVAPQTDINIVLSHAGLAIDTKISNVEGVSAVIGADDHYIITEPIYYPGENDSKSTPIVQAGGEQDQYLGRLDLEFIFAEGAWNLSNFDGYLYDLNAA